MEGNTSTSLLIEQESSGSRPGLFRRLAKFFKRFRFFSKTLFICPLQWKCRGWHGTRFILSIGDVALPFWSYFFFYFQFRFATSGQIATYIVACTLSLLIGLVTPAYIYIISRLTTIYVNEKSVRSLVYLLIFSWNALKLRYFQPIGNEEFLWKVWKLASFYFMGFLLVITLEYIQVC